MTKKHIHNWQFVNLNIRIDEQGNMFKDNAMFICECGVIKTVRIKEELLDSLKDNKTKAQEVVKK